MTTRIAIERLDARQISELAELAQKTWLATFTEGLTESDIEQALTQRDSRYFEAVLDLHHIWVAVVATDIAGFIECKSISDEVVIDKVYVSQRFQGQGVGRALMAHALDDPLLMNKIIELDVWIDNPHAIALYRSFDFEVVGERPFVSSSGDVLSPDLTMRRSPL